MSDTNFPFISALEKTIQKHIENNNLVEVVRCKDCKHYKGLAECDVIGDCMGTDGYCAWGEKKCD